MYGHLTNVPGVKHTKEKFKKRKKKKDVNKGRLEIISFLGRHMVH